MGCITSIGKARKSTNGYSTVYVPELGKKVKAHRHIFEQAFGPIPPNLVVMHICDNRACTNLQHLKLGTQSANLKDMYNKGRQGEKNLPDGESHHKTTVTQEDVDLFRQTPYYRGLFFRWAKEHNVSRPTARNIYLGKTWKKSNYAPPDLEDLVTDKTTPGFEYYGTPV